MGKRNAHNLDFGGFSLVRTVICLARIDRFTDTAAILNKLDLSSIMGCPGGHEHIPLSIYERLSKIVMGKKIVVPC